MLLYILILNLIATIAVQAVDLPGAACWGLLLLVRFLIHLPIV
jgi:hypothetical protein